MMQSPSGDTPSRLGSIDAAMADQDYLEEECWSAFQKRNRRKALRLLPMLDDPDLVKDKIRISDLLQLPIPFFDDDVRFDMSLLDLSSRNGWLDVTKDLITKYHFDPHHIFHRNCLHFAAMGNHVKVVEYLVTEHKLDPLYQDGDDNHTALHFAAANGSLAVLRYLISHYHYNLNDKELCTILHCAVKHIDVVKFFINECNCDPMSTDDENRTLVHVAAAFGSLDVVKFLINECNCDPMSRIGDMDRSTVLHMAAKFGSQDVIKFLINECNCDPMVIDDDGATPLHYATEENNLAATKFLLSTGKCDPFAKDTCGYTPLQSVTSWLDDEKLARSRGITIFKKFTKHFSKITDSDDSDDDDENYGIATFKKFTKLFSKNTDSDDSDDDKDRLRFECLSIFENFGLNIDHPLDSCVNILLLGNPGAGKSTLGRVISDTATGSFTLGSIRNVKGVEPCTAGIIPIKLQHKKLGSIILHDFAGHSEYYSSHSAVIQNLLQDSGAVFLIVVNILEKEAIKQLRQWLTLVADVEQCSNEVCHVIVVASHVDEISDSMERRKKEEEIQELIKDQLFTINKELECDTVFLDCRKLGGNSVDFFFDKLSCACKLIRNENGRDIDRHCQMMYRLLEEGKENIFTLSNVVSAFRRKYNSLSEEELDEDEILDSLDSLHSIGVISVFRSEAQDLESEDKGWIVVNKGILLSDVNGILFAPKTFKEHVDIASNTGIVSVSGLTRLFPDYDPDMLICFLKNMELCQEVNSSFLGMTNLCQMSLEGEVVGGVTERNEKRLLFFPCLLHSDRPDKLPNDKFQFGWYLQCSRDHDFFPPQYFHILSLHLAYKWALPREDDVLNRYCTFWKNGLHWFDGHGVGTLVEIVDESQCVLVLMSCEEGCNDKLIRLRREVISEVLSVKKSCPSLGVKDFVIDPEELSYPVKIPRARIAYSLRTVMAAIVEGRSFLVNNKGHKELKRILTGESLSDVTNLSLLGKRDVKVSISICTIGFYLIFIGSV